MESPLLVAFHLTRLSTLNVQEKFAIIVIKMVKTRIRQYAIHSNSSTSGATFPAILEEQ